MRFRLFLKSFDKELIGLACEQLRQTLLQTDCELKGLVALPTRIKRFCVLRSPHVDKDSREHFEVRFYKRFLDLTTDSPSVFDFLLKTELPSGVLCSLKILTESIEIEENLEKQGSIETAKNEKNKKSGKTKVSKKNIKSKENTEK